MRKAQQEAKGAPKAKARRRRVQARREEDRTVADGKDSAWLAGSPSPPPLHTPLALPLRLGSLGLRDPLGGWSARATIRARDSTKVFFIRAPQSSGSCRNKKEIDSFELVFNCSGKFVIRENSDCVQKPGMLIATGKPESRVARNSKSDAASSSQVKLQDAYLGGLTEKVAGKLVATYENQVLWEIL